MGMGSWTFLGLSVALVVGLSGALVQGPQVMSGEETEGAFGAACDCPYKSVTITTATCPENCASGSYYTGLTTVSGPPYDWKVTEKDACGDVNCHGLKLKEKVSC